MELLFCLDNVIKGGRYSGVLTRGFINEIFTLILFMQFFSFPC